MQRILLIGKVEYESARNMNPLEICELSQLAGEQAVRTLRDRRLLCH
jgi:hypothetical protein